MSYTSPIYKGSNVGAPNSVTPFLQANQTVADELSTCVSLFNALNIKPQGPKSLSEAQLKEWERLFVQKFSAVLQDDPHPALCMPNTPFSVWVTQELFLLVISIGVKDDLIVQLVRNLGAYLQTYSTNAKARFRSALTDIENYLNGIKSELSQKINEKAQIFKIIDLLHHLERGDKEVLKTIWFDDMTHLVTSMKTSRVKPNMKQTTNELLRSIKVFVTLFLQDANKLLFTIIFNEPIDEMLNSKSILNGNIEFIERDISHHDLFHRLIPLCEGKFDLGENNLLSNVDANIVYVLKSLFISACNLQRQLIVQEIIDKKCCGSLEETMIVLLADQFLEHFALLPDCLKELSSFNNQALTEWQFYQKLISDLEGLLKGPFKNSLDALKNHPGSSEAMQSLLLTLFELEDTFGIYQDEYDSLKIYWDTNIPNEPAFDILDLKYFQYLIDCMWALSRDKLPCTEERSKRSKITTETLMKYFNLKPSFDRAAENSPPMQNGTLTSKRARNIRQREKLKQKKQALKANALLLSTSATLKVDDQSSQANKVATVVIPVVLPEKSILQPVVSNPVTSPTVEVLPSAEHAEIETDPQVREVSKAAAALIPSKKQKRRKRQLKRAEKEASLSPIQLLSAKALKGRKLFDFLFAAGWTENRQRGTHVIMKHQAFSGSIIVPKHSTLKEGTAKAIVNQIHGLQSSDSSR